jgi:hypothetical protein
MVDAAISCDRMRGLARLGRFQGCRAAGPRFGADDLMASIT